jgi:DNA-binding response OmpR family regulator
MNTILVVDDELPFRKAVAATLRREGYEVFEAGDGVEGLALATAQLPSIVLSDVNMNGRNGLELLRELRIRPETSSIPVIMMTGEPQKTSSRFSMEHGADDYLQKPFKMEALLAAVQARLERRTSISRSMAAQQKAERLSAAEKIRLQTSALDAAANGIAITKPNGKILCGTEPSRPEIWPASSGILHRFVGHDQRRQHLARRTRQPAQGRQSLSRGDDDHTGQ